MLCKPGRLDLRRLLPLPGVLPCIEEDEEIIELLEKVEYETHRKTIVDCE